MESKKSLRERQDTDKSSAASFAHYLGRFQLEVGHSCVPNLFESLKEILIAGTEFPWVSSKWCSSKTEELEAHLVTLSKQPKANEPIEVNKRTKNPFAGELNKYSLPAFFCQNAGEFHAQAAASKLLIFSAIVDAQDEKPMRVPKILSKELRAAQNQRGMLETLLQGFPSTNSSEFMTELPKYLTLKKTPKRVESLRISLHAFLSRRQFSLTRGLGIGVQDGVSKTAKRKLSKVGGGSKVGEGENRADSPMYFKPLSRTQVREVDDSGAVVGVAEMDEEGVSVYRFYFDEDIEPDLEEGLVDDTKIDEDSPEPAIPRDAIRSSHWMRHQRSISPTSLRVLTFLERKRFLSEHLTNIKGPKRVKRAWSLANLVSYQTPISALNFLFNEALYSEQFDNEGRYILGIVRVDTGYKPLGKTAEKFRGYLKQVKLRLKGNVGDTIAELRLKPECKTFADALGVTRLDIKKVGKKMTKELCDSNRFAITQSKIENALFNALSDVKDNSSLAFLLAGKPSQMHTTLLFYWGVPEQKLLDIYESVVEDFLWQ